MNTCEACGESVRSEKWVLRGHGGGVWIEACSEECYTKLRDEIRGIVADIGQQFVTLAENAEHLGTIEL